MFTRHPDAPVRTARPLPFSAPINALPCLRVTSFNEPTIRPSARTLAVTAKSQSCKARRSVFQRLPRLLPSWFLLLVSPQEAGCFPHLRKPPPESRSIELGSISRFSEVQCARSHRRSILGRSIGDQFHV